MKKVLIALFLVLMTIPFMPSLSASQATTQVYFHYYRYQADYSPWDLWVWKSEPTSEGGSGFSFVADDTGVDYNFGGVVAKVSLTGTLADATRIGFIVRKPDWSQKDVDNDRFVNVPATSADGIFHVYLVEGDPAVGTFLNDPSGPSNLPKFKQVYFTAINKIFFSATEAMTETDLVVKANNVPVSITSVAITGLTGVITIAGELDFSKNYQLFGTFSDDVERSLAITYDGIYSTEAFENVFGYTGNDLGAVIHPTKTSFRVWAPVATNVVLNLYSTGTPANLGGSNVPTQQITMTKDVNGTYYTEVAGNLHGTYYTYSVTNGSATHETIDPYAKSAGINGIRGLVVDFSQTNPTGFEYGVRPANMTHATDAIIYELHVRDLTTHSSWNGTEINRGRFLGLMERGTTYQGVKTGFDHIIDLGVTHVQFIPIFDFGVLDETKINTEGYNSFNWGYMPLNFNVLEGAYSANPYDGLVRIQEFKQVVAAYHAQDIRIIMDVVYNHHGLTADSNFNLIVPGYYFRKNANGSFSNGSGTGNETSSERIMMRKFMIDSLVFWTQEYNMSGFRFDLMALHDVETMNQIATALRAIDPTILIFGEPWMGGSSPLPASQQAGKSNLKNMPYIGAFNDDFRDAVKGSVFNRTEGGYIHGLTDASRTNRVKYGIVGGIQHPQVTNTGLSTQNIWHMEPTKTLNYVTAHDNNTLHDKLYQSLEEMGKLELLYPLMKQGNAMVLTAQGISFLHAGDEFNRTKPGKNNRGFDHNSYESPDSVNQLRWDHLASANGQEMFAYYQGLIALRKATDAFRIPTAQAIRERLTFVYTDLANMIAYTITSDDAETILVIHNANQTNTKLELPKNGGWRVLVNGEDAGTDTLETFKGGQRITLTPNASYVMIQDPTIGDVSAVGWIVGGVSSSLAVIGVVVFFIIKRKGLPA